MRLSVAIFPLIASTATASLRRGRELQTASITKIVLINADTDEEVTSVNLGVGGDISLGSLPSTKLNIQAVTQGIIGKVQFNYNGKINFRSEGAAPYAFCGDSGGNYGACVQLVEGTHSVTAIAFVGGQQVDTKTVTFSLVTGTSTATPPPVGPNPTAPPVGPNPTAAPVPNPTAAPVPTPTPPGPGSPTTPPLSLNGSWEIFQNQNIDGRHEACFVMAGGKAYLIGGRESQDVDVFDPVSRSWSKGSKAPDLLHHMQCVSVGGKIYLAAAWTGYYPQEDNADVMWVYNTANDQWSAEQAIPEPRRRGSAAVVVDGTKIWVSHGNSGGHEQSNFATSYGWIDYYDTVSKTWVLGNQAGFPDAPNPRDHTGGALVNGRICVTGGRDGGLDNWPAVAPTDCFDPSSKTWSVEASIPVNRSGSAYGTSCDGKLIVAGGERGISSRVDVFDGQNWSSFANGLIDSRHGTGLAVDCVRNLIYIASGAPNNGGGNVKSLEIYTP